MAAPPRARPELARTTTCHGAVTPMNKIKCGRAEPMVKAPTRMPTAVPLRTGDHSVTIFTATGYTPTIVTPVSIRKSVPVSQELLKMNRPFTTAPATAAVEKIQRELNLSTMPVTELIIAPTTKPSCTEAVNKATSTEFMCHWS